MPRGIQGSGTATMTRPRSGTTINKTMQPWSTVLFQFGNLVGLPANNQYGFDILAYQGNGYVSVLNDPKFCAQVIGWLLQKQGNLKGAIGGNVNAANTGAVGRRNANATGATAGTATHATTPIRRAVATGRSRTTVRRSQTPALATSGANVNSSSGA